MTSKRNIVKTEREPAKVLNNFFPYIIMEKDFLSQYSHYENFIDYIKKNLKQSVGLTSLITLIIKCKSHPKLEMSFITLKLMKIKLKN